MRGYLDRFVVGGICVFLDFESYRVSWWVVD